MSEAHIPSINQLPPEALAEILCLVPPKSIELVVQNGYPWKLALVCRFWRDVVFSIPQLWANINVQLDPMRRSRLDTRSSALLATWKLCLQRSGGHPLSIYLDATSTRSIAFVPSLLKPLMKHVEQWETMIFGFPVELLLPFLADHNNGYPRLRAVTLRGMEGTTIDGAPLGMKIFQDAPLLSYLSFHEFPSPLQSIRLPWAQITDLEMRMSEWNSRDLLEALRGTPNLTTLFFSVFLITPTFEARPSQTLYLPHLRKLSWITYTFELSDFFDFVSMPNLSEVKFQCEDDNWRLGTMEGFLRRSGCRITSITLNMTSSHLASSFLSILPDVEIVKLYAVPGNEGLMRSLTFHDDSTTSWVGPKIRKIVMDSTPIQMEAHDAFIAMVQSRLRVPPYQDSSMSGRGRPLESLQLETSLYPLTDMSRIGLFEAFEVLQERLSPEEIALVAYKEKSLVEWQD